MLKHEIPPGIPFKVQETPPVTITALEVAHSGIEGAVIYVAEISSKKVVFGWDIDVPDAQRPSDRKKNLDVITENAQILSDASLLIPGGPKELVTPVITALAHIYRQLEQRGCTLCILAVTRMEKATKAMGGQTPSGRPR